MTKHSWPRLASGDDCGDTAKEAASGGLSTQKQQRTLQLENSGAIAQWRTKRNTTKAHLLAVSC